jgi:dihydroorotate dehydrogenase (NAD+) catalytic subunit
MFVGWGIKILGFYFKYFKLYSMISTKLCGVELENPTVLASGILGVTAASLARVASAGAGAVTKKSIGPKPRAGHDNPTMVEVAGGYLNAMGLPTPGVDEAVREVEEYKKLSKTPIIASFYGSNSSEFAEVARKLDGKADLLEANISCPNVQHDFGHPFAASCEDAAQVTKAIKKVAKTPLLVKLSPNVPNIGEVARSVEKAGADGITAINTVGPGMVIDLKTRKPILANKAGGMSGPAVKPIMVRCVYDIYEAVKIPILAVGGITTGEDAAEAIMAGARAVGIGTGIKYRGVEIFKDVKRELAEVMKKEGFNKLDEMVGAAHG